MIKNFTLAKINDYQLVMLYVWTEQLVNKKDNHTDPVFTENDAKTNKTDESETKLPELTPENSDNNTDTTVNKDSTDSTKKDTTGTTRLLLE